MDFRIVSPIRNVETFARGHGIRELRRLNKAYGAANWRKRKGHAIIELQSGARLPAEIHWYEAHRVGRKEFKIKRLLD
ncbi:hypothetical protein CK501_14435 [Halovibrio salipaludis]|uniref:Uncharacterized protein n=1 Tax=Halovibrio salipaludis TaxID=2032626 RepID=A0A2A2EZI7_9GAMM|nr:hypothetical protein [Halovibrio salipaludis]PAU77884.1 hypothetical protein CK501_14435 [Halovibrio salipaludis]